MPVLPLALVAAAVATSPPLRPAPPPAAEPDPLDDAYRTLARATAGEPAVAEVQAAAGRRAADAFPAPEGAARARLAALLPRFTAEFRSDQRSYRVAGLQSSGEVDYVRSSPGQEIALRATWELSALLTPAPPPSAAGASERARRRDEAAQRATELWFERRRLQLTLLLDPPAAPLARAELELEIARRTAELDVLTGGLFGGGR